MFETEAELVNTLKKALSKLNSSGYTEIFDEVSLGYGVADLVVSNFTNSTCRWVSNRFLLNSNDINIYSIIENEQGITLEKIANLTRQSFKLINKSLNKLTGFEYVINQEGKFFIKNYYQVSFENLFAIEAKLKNWKRALKQAYRYKWFADYSYVVLDSCHIENAIKEIDLFRKYNVGLASISKDGELVRYFKPKREIPFDYKMRVLFSEKTKVSMN
ncbi:MAG: hypothetical protein JJ971_02155 [Balneolaceae bacterium]|nr:hypothetical protein [Balneolaceae bacterium]MBO6545175.1 hypothetical protein [Balneolaceae bacterium]MBO6646571.1 hypothetical protein [Balneolaceae bacterium]